MKFPSFFTALLLGNLLLISSILGLGFWRIMYNVNQHSTAISKRFQELLIFTVKGDLEESWRDSERIIEQYCRSYSRIPEFRLTIIDIDGRVLGDSECPAEKMEPHNTEQHPEVFAILTNQQSQPPDRTESFRFSRTKQMYYRYIASPVQVGGKTVAVIRVAFPVTDILKNERNIFYRISLGFVLMLFVAVILSVFLSWIWYRPLRLISSSARRIAEGNFEPVPELSAPRELVQLIDSINRMCNTVASQLETISRQREQLQTILYHLPDAVFALNAHDQVVYYNESAKGMFNLGMSGELCEPIPVQHLLRYAPVLDFYFQEHEALIISHRNENTPLKAAWYRSAFSIDAKTSTQKQRGESEIPLSVFAPMLSTDVYSALRAFAILAGQESERYTSSSAPPGCSGTRNFASRWSNTVQSETSRRRRGRTRRAFFPPDG
jgi:PAS domain-containing protein